MNQKVLRHLWLNKKIMKEMYRDYYSKDKPILDEYEVQEIKMKIHYAMEYNLELEFTVFDGCENVVKGRGHHSDHIDKRIRVMSEDGNVDVIMFGDIVRVNMDR